MTILVTSATGTVGRHVVTELLKAGQSVRALTRRPETAALPAEAEVRGGDLDQPDTLRAALAGAERLYLFPVPETAAEVVALAVESGVRRIVLLSGAGADDDAFDTGYRVVEAAVQSSGVDWTCIRPGEFAANWLDWAPAIRATRTLSRPYAQAVTQPTHERDIAAVAAAALLQDGHEGRTHTFAGPEALTVAAQLDTIAKALGEPIRLDELDPAAARTQWISDGYPPEVVDWLFGLWATPASLNAEWAEVVPALTGRPALTFADWANEHVAAFR
ncbi:NAD(P)H-binding protein [Nonomuraea sp. NPDC050328]|uniref:NAD(P)H-binding protein n=1 Tax=Nonomuraea sp. NPDC050328 TaxID=3364361 RepID=UPI0037896130